MPTHRILVVTGSRSEFGLLRPILAAIDAHPRLALLTAVAGEHLLPPARTAREVAGLFKVHAKVPMQTPRDRGRSAAALAAARGVEGFARAFARLKPDCVLVLGDRIEAFAAASAAAIAGIPLAHVHGGDRAEGISDESLRHAISKLAHLHFPATKQSAERLIKLGEDPRRIHTTGSPAIDGLAAIKPLSSRDADALLDIPSPTGHLNAVFLLHPSGLDPRDECRIAACALETLHLVAPQRTLILRPNHDPGSDIINRVIDAAPPGCFAIRDHLPRPTFLALLKHLARPRRIFDRFMAGSEPSRGVLVGNSSAGLIEAAAIGLPVVNLGPRQDGRQRGANVIDVPYVPRPPHKPGQYDTCLPALQPALLSIFNNTFTPPPTHPYGPGRAGPAIAKILAATNLADPALLRKHNTY